MATSADNLDTIVALYRSGHFKMPARIADLGCQQVAEDCVEASQRFLASFGKSAAPDDPALLKKYCFTGHLFRAAGFSYQSFDVTDAPFCDRFDLNVDEVALDLRNRFDLVFNFGTTEHIMNQYNCLKTVHDFAKPGGLIYTFFLMNGYHWHGIIRYTPRFIDLLIKANQYEVLRDDIYDQTYSQWRDLVGPDEPEDKYFRDMCRWMVWQKTSDRPFKEIVDIG
jgi:hypothetical protein